MKIQKKTVNVIKIYVIKTTIFKTNVNGVRTSLNYSIPQGLRGSRTV